MVQLTEERFIEIIKKREERKKREFSWTVFFLWLLNIIGFLFVGMFGYLLGKIY